MTGDDPAGEAAVDGGSYRDRSSKVFYHEGAVLRARDARAAANWERLAATRFFADFTGRGRLIPTQRRQPFPTPLPAGGVPVQVNGDAVPIPQRAPAGVNTPPGAGGS